jgi:hypothetical protein
VRHITTKHEEIAHLLLEQVVEHHDLVLDAQPQVVGLEELGVLGDE